MSIDLARRDTALPLDVVLDAGRLSDALGRRVEITRVRYKPGTSVVVAVRDAANGDGVGSHGWVAAYADAAKLAKTRMRAERVGASVTTVPGAPGSLAGPLVADRALAERLRRSAPAGHVLRYNPHRRLVVRTDNDVVKIAATDARGGAIARLLADAGLAVLPGAAVADGVERTPWWGRGDLATSPSPEAAVTTGRELARLHAVPVDAADVRQASDGDADLATAAAAIGVLDRAAGARAERLASRVRAMPAGERRAVVHGDFTADQVLVDHADVRFIDFDRAGHGDPERDLGYFAAAELLAGRGSTGPLRSGYDLPVDESAVTRWTATAALQRAVEPFRHGRADWAERLHLAIDIAEEAVA